MALGQNTPHTDLSRRYDVDWLRVLGMMTVFLFHNNRFFDTDGWHVKSPETSEASMMVTVLAVQWMMPLFFILSGIGIYHALAHQEWPQYLVSRVKRLLVPLLFGIFVIIAPLQVYLERISHKQFEGSFWSFYPHYFEGWFGIRKAATSPGWESTCGILSSCSYSPSSPCRCFCTCGPLQAAAWWAR